MALMQSLQAFDQYQMMVLGPILVIVIIFFPQGLVGYGGKLMRRRFARSSARA